MVMRAEEFVALRITFIRKDLSGVPIFTHTEDFEVRRDKHSGFVSIHKHIGLLHVLTVQDTCYDILRHGRYPFKYGEILGRYVPC
jgi:hypothetical protein